MARSPGATTDPVPYPRWPDLRDPEPDPGAAAAPWFLWSSQRMAELTALDGFRFVCGHLPPPPAPVFEIGCGTGWLALELCRAGYAVTAIEPNPEALALAEEVAVGEPRAPAYVASTFEDWQPDGRYAAAVAHLSLHHLADLPGAVAKLRRALAPAGRLVAVEFVYDRLDLPTAHWLQRAEEECGVAAAADAEALRAEWLAYFAEHGLHGEQALRGRLARAFRQLHFSWATYLVVRLGNALPGRDTPVHDKWLTQMKDVEAQAIAAGAIQAVAFRYAGTLAAADGA